MWSLFRRNGQFRRLFCAQLVSYAGDWFATVAAIGLLLDHTGSDLLASLFWVAQSLPTFVMAPIAGPVVDRRECEQTEHEAIEGFLHQTSG